MAQLPTGTVTFLFTDIEGSTRLWERDASSMQAALARHDVIMCEAIAAHGGAVFKTVGDAFCAVFATAPTALFAALSAQRTLSTEEGSTECLIRVRMALHTGSAEEREDDYFGPPVNRVARLLAAGHGGQTLLSAVTQELVRDHLPEGVTLQNLGEHRLKDLIRPDNIFQVIAPGLPSGFPSLKTLDAHPHNLPIQPTPFIGRQREVEDVCTLLQADEARLVTLTGPGGTGKTRLALQVAAEVVERFPGGVFFVPLAPVTNPDLVISTIAEVLGVRESADHTLLNAMKVDLRDKRLLLVLDNFEQVVEARTLVSDLLATCPALTVLVTSREVLHLYGEQTHTVPPLALPRPRELPPPTQLALFDAIALFLQQARAAIGDFDLTLENASAVAQICDRLDGLPLAIELAAARINVLPPGALLPRLERRLALLTGGARDRPARQQTLRGTLDWSHELLDELEQRLFRRLAVFAGGWTLEAAAAVCDVEAEMMEVLDGITSLLDKSLVRREMTGESEPRFMMLATIREYALERLDCSSEADTIRRRYAEFYAAMAERGESGLMGSQQQEWLDRLEMEHDNLRAVLGWSLKQEEATVGLRLVGLLWRFWGARGHLSEGRRWAEGLLRLENTVDAAIRARALNCAGLLAHFQGDIEDAKTLFEKSLALRRERGEKHGIAGLLCNLGMVTLEQGDYERARQLQEESVALHREVGDRWGVATALTNLGLVAMLQEDYQHARQIQEESLALGRELGDTWGVAAALCNLGILAHIQADNERATVLLKESLLLSQQLGDKRLVAEALEALAGVAGAQKQPERAARLFGAAKVLREAVGIPLAPGELPHYEQSVALARRQVDDALWQTAWRAGRLMTEGDAVTYARSGCSSPEW